MDARNAQRPPPFAERNESSSIADKAAVRWKNESKQQKGLK
jgi:hypothetical protein